MEAGQGEYPLQKRICRDVGGSSEKLAREKGLVLLEILEKNSKTLVDGHPKNSRWGGVRLW